MFKLTGIKEILVNIIRLTYSRLHEAPNKKNLQRAYRSFLREMQPRVTKSENVDLSFLWQKEDIASLLEVFKEESFLDDFGEVFDLGSDDAYQMPIARVRQAILKMREINPSFADLFGLVIHTIFSAPSKLAGGGSTSSAIGCIWVDLRPHWAEQDVLEFLVHEITHNLVFIDELCYTHYSSYVKIAERDNFATSAILSKQRPLDKVFHSILVSVEVLLFRQEHLGHPDRPCLHPPTPILLDQTLRSIKSITETHTVERLLTDRAKSLLKMCVEKLETIESPQLSAI